MRIDRDESNSRNSGEYQGTYRHFWQLMTSP